MAPFRSTRTGASSSWTTKLLVAVAIIAALYLGREVLAPLALALLLTIAGLPPVAWLERRGVPRIPVVLLILIVVIAVVALMLYVVIGQALALAEVLPRYETVLREKIASLSGGSGPIDGVLRLVNRLGVTSTQPDPAPATTVVVATAEHGRLAGFFGLLHVVLAPAATLAITLLLMAFLLVQREDVRDRVRYGRLPDPRNAHELEQQSG